VINSYGEGDGKGLNFKLLRGDNEHVQGNDVHQLVSRKENCIFSNSNPFVLFKFIGREMKTFSGELEWGPISSST